MILTNRNIWAIVYSSLLFGSLSVPYYYILIGILIHSYLADIWIIAPWLAICTSLLLLILISRSRIEEKLANKLGRYFKPLAIAMAVLALGSIYFIGLGVANVALFVSVEYWSYLILISGIATGVSFAVVIATRPSRLEQFIAFKLSRANRSYIRYRVVGYLTLAAIFIFACSELYQYYCCPRPTWH